MTINNWHDANALERFFVDAGKSLSNNKTTITANMTEDLKQLADDIDQIEESEEEIEDENGNKKKLYIVSKSSPYLTKLFNDIESWVNKD